MMHGMTQKSVLQHYKEITLSLSSFSEESVPVVSSPDQEPARSVQAEAAPRPSSALPAHSLSGVHVG